MKKTGYLLLFAFDFVLGMFVFMSVSSAYLEPSQIAFLVSGITAAVFAISTSLELFWGKLRRKFGKGGTTDITVSTLSRDDGFDDSDFDVYMVSDEILAAYRTAGNAKKKRKGLFRDNDDFDDFDGYEDEVASA